MSFYAPDDPRAAGSTKAVPAELVGGLFDGTRMDVTEDQAEVIVKDAASGFEPRGSAGETRSGMQIVEDGRSLGDRLKAGEAVDFEPEPREDPPPVATSRYAYAGVRDGVRRYELSGPPTTDRPMIEETP